MGTPVCPRLEPESAALSSADEPQTAPQTGDVDVSPCRTAAHLGTGTDPVALRMAAIERGLETIVALLGANDSTTARAVAEALLKVTRMTAEDATKEEP